MRQKKPELLRNNRVTLYSMPCQRTLFTLLWQIILLFQAWLHWAAAKELALSCHEHIPIIAVFKKIPNSNPAGEVPAIRGRLGATIIRTVLSWSLILGSLFMETS